VNNEIIDKIKTLRKTKPIYTKNRNSTILFSFIDRTFYIYNGKTYYKLFITKDQIGFKLGSFSHSKKRCIYRVKKKVKKK
jgi:ribosomal protein S19